MTTAQVLFEQYKVLPPRVKQQYRKLIEESEKSPKPEVVDDDDETGDTIRISREALATSIEQVRLLRAGKAELSTMEELLASLEDDE